MERDANFSLLQYDCIGFDLDHTLCKYRLSTVLPLIHHLVTEYLIEKRQYSIEIREEFCPKLCQKGLILDKSRGNILKLSCNYHIIAARHGNVMLTDAEITHIYGPMRVWDELRKIPECIRHGTQLNDKFVVFKDYFTSPCVQICAKIVEVIDANNDNKDLNQLNSYNFWDDIYNGLWGIYERSNFKRKTSGFFNELRSNPDLYLEKCSNPFKDYLLMLKSSGKMLFLLTSSNVDFASFLAEHCLGSDWRKYFDGVFTFARKPTFFVTNRPFLKIKNNEEHAPASSLKYGSMYSQGNATEMEKFFANRMGKSKVNCIYFGDSLQDDCFMPNRFSNWHSIAIVEELNEHKSHHLDPSLWGSFFSDNGNYTLWCYVIRKYCRIALSKLEDIAFLDESDTLPILRITDEFESFKI